jgi:hypothetical protein
MRKFIGLLGKMKKPKNTKSDKKSERKRVPSPSDTNSQNERLASVPPHENASP